MRLQVTLTFDSDALFDTVNRAKTADVSALFLMVGEKVATGHLVDGDVEPLALDGRRIGEARVKYLDLVACEACTDTASGCPPVYHAPPACKKD